VVIRSMGCTTMCVLEGVSEGGQLPPDMILNGKTVPKKQLCCCIAVRFLTKGCKTNKLFIDVEQKVMGGTE
jgi:hypothetical protein